MSNSEPKLSQKERWAGSQNHCGMMEPMEWKAEIENGLQKVSDQLFGLRTTEGHWVGKLSSSALSTATAITAIGFYLDATGVADNELQRQVEAGICWLVQQQNKDGGFGDTPLSHSNISTTFLAVASLHACHRADEFESCIAKAQRYIDSKGGIKGLRDRYGNDKTFAVPILAHCAMAGIVPWREVSALPFEAACVPQRFYNLMQLPVVSYAIPALVAIGQAKFIHDPPWDPIRKTIRRLCVEPSLKVLERMQPESGGFLEAVPLTSFVAMALVKCGRHEHPVVKAGIRFLRESFRADHNDESGTWPIDTNLATWGTTLAVNALANDNGFFRQQLSTNKEQWRKCVDWIISCQTKTKHPFTGAQPGGFGWTDLSGAVPDADDTPGAMIALKHFSDNADAWCEPSEIDRTKNEIEQSALAGVQWLVDLQNRDSGWPTFCKGWGKLPFDRSGADITAHSIRGLLAWQDRCPDPKVTKAIDRGFRYLQRQQRPDGSWLPLWFGNQDTEGEINPWYGTSKVLLAYREANLFDTEPAKIGLEWIAGSQNEDGGWGGGESLNWAQLHQTFKKDGEAEHSQSRDLSSLGTSSVEETALCTETLLHAADCGSLDDTFRDQLRESAAHGVRWLIDAIELDCVSIHWPIGFYFAKLWYYEKMYPLVFAASTLAKSRSMFDDPPQNEHSPNKDYQQQPERDDPGGTRRNIHC